MDGWGTRLWCNTILDFLEIKSFLVGSHLAGDVRGVSQGARGEVGRALSRGTTATSAAASTRGNCLQGTVVSWYRHCSTRTLRQTCTLCSVVYMSYFIGLFQARGVHSLALNITGHWYNAGMPQGRRGNGSLITTTRKATYKMLLCNIQSLWLWPSMVPSDQSTYCSYVKSWTSK